MAGFSSISKGDINITELFSLVKTNVMANLNCHNIGKIIEFDPTTQLCTVELQQVKQFNGIDYNPVPIVDIPLIILGVGNAYITMPDPVGTICLLLFLDRNMDAFLETGETYTPETTRMHDFTDCVALTTFKTLANPIEEYDTEAITLLNKEVTELVKNNAYIKIYPDKIEQKVTQITTDEQGEETTLYSSIDITSELVDITSDKFSVHNTSQNLATLIQSFLTACENITVDTNTGLLTSASKQAFTDLKTQFEELLQ